MKASSNASTDTFHTADQERLSDSPQPSESSQPVHIDDVTQTTLPDREDTAKSFAGRAWSEDPTFVDREKLVEWLGSPMEIRQQALSYYMANFDFGGIDIDEAIRRLCRKLYIKGKTQQIDRIFGSFSKQYMEQNPGAIWRYAGNSVSKVDIVHVVAFAIILLNTDLQAAELQAHITSNRFVDNTIDAIRSQLREPSPDVTTPTHDKLSAPEYLPDIQELPQPQTPTTPVQSTRTSSPPNLERHTSNARNRLSSFGSTTFNRDDWVVPALPNERNSMELAGSERWITDVTRELSTIYRNVRTRPILQPKSDDSLASQQSKVGSSLLKRSSAKLYHSLRGEILYPQFSSSPPTSGASFVSVLGHRVSSSIGLTSSPSTNMDLGKFDSPWAKTGPMLWKSMKPTSGRIAKPKRWLSVLATVRNSILDMSSPLPPGANAAAGRRLGALSLLHALAVEAPAPRGSKARSFGLALASGETHVFEIQANQTGSTASGLFKPKSRPTIDPDAEVLAWVHACNFHAARYSRAPLPDGVTNVEYGWNDATVCEDDDQSSVSSKGRNSVLIDDWAAPTLPTIETELDLDAQLEAWNHQIKMCSAEFAEHGDLRSRMMNLYRPGSVQAQKALSNWEKKAQYLLAEIVKYETYAEILKNAEPSAPVPTFRLQTIPDGTNSDNIGLLCNDVETEAGHKKAMDDGEPATGTGVVDEYLFNGRHSGIINDETGERHELGEDEAVDSRFRDMEVLEPSATSYLITGDLDIAIPHHTPADMPPTDLEVSTRIEPAVPSSMLSTPRTDQPVLTHIHPASLETPPAEILMPEYKAMLITSPSPRLKELPPLSAEIPSEPTRSVMPLVITADGRRSTATISASEQTAKSASRLALPLDERSNFNPLLREVDVLDFSSVTSDATAIGVATVRHPEKLLNSWFNAAARILPNIWTYQAVANIRYHGAALVMYIEGD
ncbi:hypothetical protein FRC07_014821 [Ceratobasidium sp. 392]|nr:hypothetical protein FRC07_014821 [Ceratobasidium sp. 392]